MPELGVLGDERRPAARVHAGVVEDDDLGAVLGHPVVAAREVLRLADDDGTDPELADQAAAVPAGESVVTMTQSA